MIKILKKMGWLSMTGRVDKTEIFLDVFIITIVGGVSYAAYLLNN